MDLTTAAAPPDLAELRAGLSGPVQLDADVVAGFARDEAVLADGRVLHTGGVTLKRSTGYDLTQLLFGSEGTLAVITAATVRLHPLPPPQLTTLATFPTLAVAVALGERAPTLLELMDGATVRAVDAHLGTGFGAEVRAGRAAHGVDPPSSTSLPAGGNGICLGRICV